ncbi:hypothetical protein MMC11_002018 [Xylographa trunciseda]|nr:hypothetical protein [Xylographa trunciseda]
MPSQISTQFLLVILCIFHFISFTYTTTTCGECKPLEWLTHQGFGIDFALDGLSSAVRLRDGSFASRSKISASPAYINLLLRSEGETLSPQWKDVTYRLTPPPPPIICKDPRDLWCRYRRWREPHPRASPRPESPPLNDDELVIYDALMKLQDSDRAFGGPLMYYVGLSLPNFVSDTLASYIMHAAEKANLSIVDIGSNAAAAAQSHGLHLGRIIADGYESSERLVMVVEYGNMALVVSLLTLPTPYGLYVDDSVISNEFDADLGADMVRDWKILTRWMNDLVIKTKPRTITNVVLNGARSTDAGFQQAIKNSYVGGLLESVPMSEGKVDPSFDAASGEATIADQQMKEFDSDCITPLECYPILAEATRRLAKSEL